MYLFIFKGYLQLCLGKMYTTLGIFSLFFILIITHYTRDIKEQENDKMFQLRRFQSKILVCVFLKSHLALLLYIYLFCHLCSFGLLGTKFAAQQQQRDAHSVVSAPGCTINLEATAAAQAHRCFVFMFLELIRFNTIIPMGKTNPM